MSQTLAATLKAINAENEVRQIQIQKTTDEGNNQKEVHDATMALVSNAK